ESRGAAQERERRRGHPAHPYRCQPGQPATAGLLDRLHRVGARGVQVEPGVVGAGNPPAQRLAVRLGGALGRPPGESLHPRQPRSRSGFPRARHPLTLRGSARSGTLFAHSNLLPLRGAPARAPPRLAALSPAPTDPPAARGTASTTQTLQPAAEIRHTLWTTPAHHACGQLPRPTAVDEPTADRPRPAFRSVRARRVPQQGARRVGDGFPRESSTRKPWPPRSTQSEG